MKRDTYYDALKFVMIFFVVCCHTFSYYANPDGSFDKAMVNFILVFNMPLFIFISGRFSHIKDRGKYRKTIIKILETYITFQLIRTGFNYAFGEPLKWQYLIIPRWALWYLVSLIFWRLMVYFMPEKWLQHRNIVIICSFFIGILAGFIPVNKILSLQRTLAFLPFFTLGYYSYGMDTRKITHKIPAVAAWAVLILSFLSIYFFFNYNLKTVLQCAYPYWADNFGQTMMNCLSRCILQVCTIIVCIMFMRVVPDCKNLAKWGEATMIIYIYHTFVINIIFDNFSLPQHSILLLIYTFAITFTLIWLNRVNFLHFLLNPITNLKKSFNHDQKA